MGGPYLVAIEVFPVGDSGGADEKAAFISMKMASGYPQISDCIDFDLCLGGGGGMPPEHPRFKSFCFESGLMMIWTERIRMANHVS